MIPHNLETLFQESQHFILRSKWYILLEFIQRFFFLIFKEHTQSGSFTDDVHHAVWQLIEPNLVGRRGYKSQFLMNVTCGRPYLLKTLINQYRKICNIFSCKCLSIIIKHENIYTKIALISFLSAHISADQTQTICQRKKYLTKEKE